MLETKAKSEAIDVSRLLDGVAKTMRSARYCWLATATEAGAPHARPMGRILNDPGEDQWKVRFPYKWSIA
jgi:general stress protein 26